MFRRDPELTIVVAVLLAGLPSIAVLAFVIWLAR